MFEKTHTNARDNTEVPRNMHMIYNAKTKLKDRSLREIGGDHDIREKSIFKNPDPGGLYVLLLPHVAILLEYKWHLELLKLNATPLVFEHPDLTNYNEKKNILLALCWFLTANARLHSRHLLKH